MGARWNGLLPVAQTPHSTHGARCAGVRSHCLSARAVTMSRLFPAVGAGERATGRVLCGARCDSHRPGDLHRLPRWRPSSYEWHHLIAAQHRLSGLHPAAPPTKRRKVRLLEDDPWLAEGFAGSGDRSHARPGRADWGAAAVQSRRRSAWRSPRADPDDPHAFGYRLVRGISTARPAASLRDLLVANLHSLPAVAHLTGVDGKGAVQLVTLHRPANAAVIPAITFTWDDGSIFDMTRRLVLPNIRPEH